MEVKCPHCKKIDHYDEDDMEILADKLFHLCEGCGRKLSVEVESGTMECDTCHRTSECDCVESVRFRPFCWQEKLHTWDKTLSPDIEKCSRCFDLRYTKVPVAA